MGKINIKVTIKNAEGLNNYVVPAIYDDDNKTIIYKEPDEDKTTVKFNFTTKSLDRENTSLIMKYKFNKEKNSEGIIYVKGMNRKFYVTIKTIKMIKDNNNIDIDYQIENDKFTYKIEVI